MTIALIPDKEVYVRDEVVFPLAKVAEKALADFSNASREQLDEIGPLPVPFIEDVPASQAKSRRVYITYRRMLDIGAHSWLHRMCC